MKKLLVCVTCFWSFGFLFAQRTLVAPLNPPKIFPNWVKGDREFMGHGPRVTGAVRLALSEGRGQITAFINLRLEETTGDSSTAVINETRLVYSAPAGRQIRSIITPTSLTDRFDFVLPKGGRNPVRPPVNSGPVNYLLVNGDGNGTDIGNNTDDDSYINVLFRAIVVELEPIPETVREVRLPKTLLAATIQGTLAGTRGRLNTFGPRHGDSWFLPRDAWIKFPNAVSRDTMFLSQLQEVVISPRRYYYNDINLNSIRGDANGQYLRLTANWESDGPEFRGECVNDAGCMFGTPTVQLNNFRIAMNVRPFVAGGRLMYDQFDVQVDFNYDYSADCGVITELCKEVFKDPVQNAFFNARFMLANVLGSSFTLDQISAALTSGVLNFARTIGRFPEASAVVEVLDDGRDLIVRVR